MNKKYIFRWKSDGIEVWPSKADTEDACWEWAIKWLRAAGESDAVAVEHVRSHGEVVECEE